MNRNAFLARQVEQAQPGEEDKGKVYEHIDKADLSAFEKGGKHFVPQDAAAAVAMPNICPVYKLIRPILVLLMNAPFIPAKWKQAIRIFVQLMDVVCP